MRLREGRNRVVRRLFESQGLKVSRLIRVSYGPIELGRGIKSAGYREATPAEVEALMEAVGLEPERPSARKRPAAAPTGRGAPRGKPTPRKTARRAAKPTARSR
ncbi:hypothetical protein [Sinimarinibacterium thermocellulolyticum]|uniref:Ribosomal large subunit pseudouridine synthase B n=1 Tax=Sinimarinibacterium thermocellulolyticum TaxID=3170016 RepID=A0ABV2A7V8_9GAMM